MLAAASGLSACAQPPAPVAVLAPVVKPVPAASPIAPTQAPVQVAASQPSYTGTASWYRSTRRLRRTSSGALLENDSLTAASSVLPLGTRVRIGRFDDSREVVVLINDRMPPNHRLIDVSELAAKELGLMGCGVATVTVTPIEVASR